ncbi:MAG TPA: FmdB family zinc ribbon protein [Tepidisphaeraceae bacterium]|jgi:putative FmdB family regulatory protein|nr:FmdB family zinc ribbon protein [Tepidisphaeraceae bacterium]
MPTYEYKCNNCGYKFEKFHSITSPAIRKCPQCGKNAVERLISAGGGLIFKGSGFYITDYRDAAYTDKAKAESEKSEAPAKADGADAKPAAEAKSDAKAEAKPDTKAPAKTEAKSESTPKPGKPEPKPAAKSSSKKR